MKRTDIIRALRDAEYRNSLSAEQLKALPKHAAGTIEMDEEALRSIEGGTGETVNLCTTQLTTCCPYPGAHCY